MIVIKRKNLFSDLGQLFNDMQHLDQSIVSRSEESSQKVKDEPVKKVEYNIKAMSLDDFMESQALENERSETKRMERENPSGLPVIDMQTEERNAADDTK